MKKKYIMIAIAVIVLVGFATIVMQKNGSKGTSYVYEGKTETQPKLSANHTARTKEQNLDLTTENRHQDGQGHDNKDLDMDHLLEELALDTWSDKLVKLLYADGSIFEVARYLNRDQAQPEELGERLLREMNSKSPRVREMSLKVAMLVPVDSMLPVFEKGLKDSSSKVRLTALQGINAMGICNDGISGSIGELLNTETDSRVQREICTFFNIYPSQIGDSEAERLSQIMKNDSEASIIAGWALSRCEIGTDEIRENLRTIYEDGKQGSGLGLAVALSAGAALAKQETPGDSFKETFLNKLSYKNGKTQRDSAFVRSSCIIGLINYSDDKQVKDSICKLLQNEDHILAFKAIKEFCSSSNSQQVELAVSERLHSLSDDIRYTPHRIELAGALTKARKVEGVEALGFIVADRDQMPVVKTMALGELRRVTGKYFAHPLFAGTPDQKVDAGNKWIEFFGEQNYD